MKSNQFLSAKEFSTAHYFQFEFEKISMNSCAKSKIALKLRKIAFRNSKHTDLYSNSGCALQLRVRALLILE